VVLPLALDWCTDGVARDLDDVQQRHTIYQLVLTEGTAEDVETYVDPRLLVELWPELTKPPAVVETWAEWIVEHQALWV